MTESIVVLSVTAASLGFIHTLLGPDHYLPFIVLSRARKWTTLKTIVITALCGLGHVGSSILLGAIGVISGIGIKKLIHIETMRGDWAAWAFIAFGIAYLLYALWRLKKNKTHKHLHMHGGELHIHEHKHQNPPQSLKKLHSHEHDTKPVNLTPWILFIVFILGPCEPLIPVLMYPAAQASVSGVIIVTAVFTLTTLLTMIGVVLAVNYGISLFHMNKIEKYTHVIAGLTITLSGILIIVGL